MSCLHTCPVYLYLTNQSTSGLPLAFRCFVLKHYAECTRSDGLTRKSKSGGWFWSPAAAEATMGVKSGGLLGPEASRTLWEALSPRVDVAFALSAKKQALLCNPVDPQGPRRREDGLPPTCLAHSPPDPAALASVFTPSACPRDF